MDSDKNKKPNQMVSVNTDDLKNQLNRVYDGRLHDGKLLADGLPQGLFDYLWDLKEKALMERRSSVEVPGNWLEELTEDAPHRRN